MVYLMFSRLWGNRGICVGIVCTLADPGSLQWNIALYACAPVAMLDFVYIELVAIFIFDSPSFPYKN